MGLPVQLPPTDDERATMCVCKLRPTPPLPLVMFNDSSYIGDEADGFIAVAVVATGVSSMPYNVTITPSELDPVSAREVLDYSNDTIVVTFNPGETNKTVVVVVNSDCIREGSEFFNLILSLNPTTVAPGITLGNHTVVFAEIKDTDSKQNFTSCLKYVYISVCSCSMILQSIFIHSHKHQLQSVNIFS